MLDYALIFWSFLAASIITILLYLKFTQGSNRNDRLPSLFENIHFMKAEMESSNESINQGTINASDSPENSRPRLYSQTSQASSISTKRKRNMHIDFKKKTHNNISDLLNKLGLGSENNLKHIYDSFEPLSIGPNVKLNTLINLQENIILVQKGEIMLSFKANAFEVTRVIQDGGIIYSKLAVLKYLINSPNRPEDVPTMETINKSCVLLKLPLKVLKSLLKEDIIIRYIRSKRPLLLLCLVRK